MFHINSIFDDLIALTSTTKYPPTTIYTSADSLYIEIATAGFSKDDLLVSTDDSYLIIEGSRQSSQYPTDAVFHQKGIAFRDFTLKYHINPTYDLPSSTITYNDGLLRIKIPKLSTKKSKKVLEIT